MDILKKRFIDALIRHKGIITRAAKSAKQARSTFYNWYNDDAEFKAAVDDIQEVALDFAEGKLFDLITKEDTTATIFYLKTKGRKRGYIEKQAEDDAPPVIISVNVTKEEQINIAKNLREQILGGQ
jgi:hypothetical protein